MDLRFTDCEPNVKSMFCFGVNIQGRLAMDQIIVDLFGLFLVIISTFVAGGNVICDSPQYVEMETDSVISCTFPSGFYSVYWYNSSESRTGFPFISLANGSKNGPGYESGEFDILSNGSLIINNVSLQHEHQLRAVMLYFESKGATEVHDVNVIVTERPTQAYPLIDVCETKRICYAKWDHFSGINCFLNNARPVVVLNLALRTSLTDDNVTSKTNVSVQGHLFKTSVQVQYFDTSHSMALFVCKEISKPSLLSQTESLVLMEINERKTSTFEPSKMFAQLNTKPKLVCTDGNPKFLVWKAKLTSDDDFRVVSYTIFDKEVTSEVVWLSEDYIVNSKGSLVIPRAGINKEGIYSCVYGDGISEGFTSYELSVFVPAHPLVQGCNTLQYCVLDVRTSGRLNCSVKGIRPQVTLEWRQVVPGDSDTKISFLKDKVTILGNPDGTYDIMLTSEYVITLAEQNRLTVECKISDKIPGMLETVARLDLMFLKESTSGSSEEIDASIKHQQIRIFCIAVGTIMVLVIGLQIVFGAKLKKVLRNGQTKVSKEKRQDATDGVIITS